MPRKLTFLVAALAITLLAAGPAAAKTAAAGNAPTIVTDPIDSWDIHEEWDGTVIESRVTGTRTTSTFPDGRYTMTEQYTMLQTWTSPSGVVVHDSVSETSIKVIAKGERTILFQSASQSQVTLADGSTCEVSFTFMVANDEVVKNEQVGPICS